MSNKEMNYAIPVINFTHIGDLYDSKGNIEDGYISSKTFEAFISYLSKNHYTFLNFSDFYDIKHHLKEPPKKAVLLTFEGAWRDTLLNAYPILKHYWAKAGLFVATEWSYLASQSKKNYDFTLYPSEICEEKIINDPHEVLCNFNEINTMRDIFEIGTMTHTGRMANFEKIEPHIDLTLSLDLIKKHFSINATHLSWPRGIYDRRILRTAQSLGIKAFYTLEHGVNLLDDDTLDIKRYQAKNSIWWFKKLMTISSNRKIYKILRIFL